MRFNTTITQPSTTTSAATHIYALPVVREIPLPKVDAGSGRTW